MRIWVVWLAAVVKISFLLKKPNSDQESLENIAMASPKKVLEGKLAGIFACEIYFPIVDTKIISIYSSNPIDAVVNATEFVKGQLQFLLNRGFTISEVESKEP